MNEITKELLDARKTIESWNSHTTTYAVDFGSNGVRDFYQAIARQSIAKAEAILAILATQQSNDNWIPWAGGDCPVGGAVIVQVEGRNGGLDTDKARLYDWYHIGGDDDIIAYRLVQK